MVCGECGGENRKNARFCSWCGVRLALHCAVCSTDIVSGAEFCDACGTPVGEPATTPAPLGARKVVTVLFADLAGSTSQHEQMDPESVRGFMDAYYAAVRDAVEDEGGRIVKLMGDGVMAAFGVPRVSEDDAVRALRAAHAMQLAFDALADRALRQFGTPVALRVGVNTGEVVVATGDNDVVGDAVNVAARLQTAAEPGEVIAGEATWRLARDVMELEALEPLVVKGKAEPVRAYRLLSVQPPAAAAPTGTTTFVGRDAELARLVGYFDDAVTSESTRLVSVIGSPGVGKSRLSREVAASLTPRATVLEAGCPPAGGATFGPVADILRDVAANEDVERAVSLLSAPQATPEELFWAIRRALASLAADQPLVVVIDDIHWAEPMLLDLIEHLAEWGRDAPILLVTLARPELRDLRPSLAEGGRRLAGVVVLEGLGGEASQRLARDLLGAGDLPAAIAGKLLAVTQGNPLFLRELVRMLVDDGVLVRDGDHWIASVDAAELDVPPTVHALLSARLERLDADERIILERAAVIGPQFPRGGVAALAPSTSLDDLDRHLEALRRRELVEPEGTYWGDEPLFRFHHVLIRDAAYRGLLREARADLHERYADWLEEKLGDAAAEQAEVLGFHLERAHEERQQLGGEPRPELGIRAARWLALAGRRALERDDVGAAAGLLGRALDRAPNDDEDRPSLLIERAEAVLAAGDVTTGVACVDVLNTLATGSDRLSAWTECFAGELANLIDPARLHATVDEVSAAAERLAAIEDFAGAAKAHGVRAQALARLGRIAECEAALDKALAAARQAGDLRRANSVLAGAPLAALWGPSPVARASGKCLDVVRVLRITSGSPAVEATALRCQAVLEALRGRDDAARRMLTAARTSLEELGLRSGLLETDLFSGLIELLAGDAVAAEMHLRAAYDGFRDLGVDVDAAQSAALLARALLAQNRDDEALRLTEESERRGGEDLKTAIAWRSARAEALARRGDTAEALRLARQAVTLAEPTDLVIDHADACAALSTVLRFAGREDDAVQEARVAAELYGRKGATAAAERLAAGAAHARPTETIATQISVPANSAAAASTRLSELIATMQWDELDDLLATDVTYEERRSGLRTGAVGKSQWVRDLRFVHSVPITLGHDLVATRGDRLRLARLRWSGDAPASGPFEGEHLDLSEIDADGHIVASIAFDAGDFAEALAEIDRRFIEGEGKAHTEEVRTLQRWVSLYNERDWDRYSEVWRPGFTVVDHRAAGWGEIDGPGYLEVLRGMVDLAPDIAATILTLDVSPSRGIALIRAAGTSVTGGAIEIHLVMDCALESGLLRQVDIYDPHELSRLRGAPTADAALHRLDELSEPPPQIENRAVSVVVAAEDAMFRRDWDSGRSSLAEDVVLDDRRMGSRTTSNGRDAVEREIRLILSAVDERTHAAYAIRGEGLALLRRFARGRDDFGNDFEVQFLQVVEIDESARIVAMTNFDSDDVAGAIALLDERYLEGEGRPFRTPLASGFAFIRAFNAGDWEDVLATLTDDFVQRDHIPVASGTTDKAEWLRMQQHMLEVAPDTRFDMVTLYRHVPWASFGLYRRTSTQMGGGEIDTSVLLVTHWRGEQIACTERFAIDQFDVALRRFDEIAAVQSRRETSMEGEGQQRLLSNRATRVGDEIVTVRGDRLALIRVVQVGSKHLELRETDTDGRVIASAEFDLENLDAAYDELSVRYRAELDPERQASFDAALEFARRFDAGEIARIPELLTGDFEMVDHTPAGFGRLHVDGIVDVLNAFKELAPNARLDIRRAEVSGSAGFVIQNATGDMEAGGGRADVWQCNVMQFRDGRFSRIERYTIEQFDEALTRFRELVGAPRSLVENPISRLLDAGDEALRASLAPGAIGDDFRAGVRTRAPISDSLDSWDAVGFESVQRETVATRGDRLAMLRVTRRRRADHDTGDAEIEHFVVVEADERDLITSAAAYDVGDLDRAYDDLDQRYLATLDPSVRPTADRAVRRVRQIFNSRDWAAWRDLNDDGFVGLDHAGTSGTLTGAQLAELLRSTAEVAPDTRMEILAVPRVAPDAVLTLSQLGGTGLGGGTTEMSALVLTAFRNGKSYRTERFAVDDIGTALARFDELTAGPLVSNSVTRLYAPLSGPDWIDRHFDYFVGMHAENVVVEARTAAGERYRTQGRDACMAEARSLYDVGLRHITVEGLAVRGDRLALMRFLNTGEPAGGGPSAVDQIAVCETSEHGLIERVVIFDPDTFPDAFTEFEERCAVIEPGALPAAPYLAFSKAFRNRDWAAADAALADDLTVVDHRPIGFGSVDRRGFLENIRAMAEIAPSAHAFTPAALRQTENSMLLLQSIFGQGLADADFEMRIVGVVGHDREHMTRYELYPIDQLDNALARFHKLQAESPAPPLANAASRILDPFDWDRFISAPSVEDLVVHDRRRVAQASIFGADAANAHADAFPTTRAEVTTLAVRGERLSLQRVLFVGDAAHGGGEVETEVLLIHELNAAGLLAAAIGFDIDDEDAAYRELDDRYIAGEAGAFAETYGYMAYLVDRLNQREWDSWTARFAEGFIYVDHKVLGVGTRSRQEFLASQREFVSLSNDMRWRVTRIDRLASRLLLARVDTTGSALAGGVAETTRLMVVAFDSNGQCTRGEGYDVEDFGAAVARFEELVAVPDRTGAITWTRSLLEQRGFEQLHRDIHFEDRRAGLHSTAVGRTEAAATLRAAFDLGLVDIQAVPIATRGDRLVLHRLTRRDPLNAVEAEHLNLVEFDEDGLLIAMVNFDIDDEDAAYRELDERYTAGEGALHAAAFRAPLQAMAFINARDWPGLASTLAVAFESVDHRPMGFATRNRQEFVDAQRQMVALSPNARWDVVGVLRTAPEASLLRVMTMGSGYSGGPTESERLLISILEDGLCIRCESFDVDDRVAAHQRFEELTATSLGGSWFAEDVVCYDRRRGLSLTTVGRRELLRSIGALPLPIVGTEPLANRGARLSLYRVDRAGDAPHGGGDAKVSFLVLHERNDAGEVVTAVLFDDHDLHGALRELDDRYRDGEATGDPVVAWITAAFAAVNGNDWERALALLSDDFEFVDRGTYRIGSHDRHGYVSLQRAFFDRPDTITFVESIVDLRADAALYVAATTSLGLAGDDATVTSYPTVVKIRNGQCILTETFAEGDLEAARARLDELDRGRPQGPSTAQRLNTELERIRREHPNPHDILEAVMRSDEDIEAVTSRRRMFVWRYCANYNRDWDALKATCAPDIVYTDHRPTGLPTARGPERIVATIGTISEVSPDAAVRLDAIHLASDDTLVISVSIVGHLGDGGDFENPFVFYAKVGDEGIRQCGAFPIDDVEAALAAAAQSIV